jgi:hypothetical protein
MKNKVWKGLLGEAKFHEISRKHEISCLRMQKKKVACLFELLSIPVLVFLPSVLGKFNDGNVNIFHMQGLPLIAGQTMQRKQAS